MKKVVAYYRVSTERQGQSGLGLEAQQRSVRDFIAANNFQIDAEFIEIESGKKNNRPVLIKALAQCKTESALLLIAKLDRLGRNLHFITAIQESGVEFRAVDNPHAGKLIIHIMAAIAEYERDQISERTTAALKSAKARGKRLGSYGRDVLSKYNMQQANAFADAMRPLIQNLQRQGINSMRSIAQELNRLHIPTYRNSKWHPTTVHLLIRRILNIENQ
ncbi:MAG TPA: recombinase family protein [Emticicia sp.]